MQATVVLLITTALAVAGAAAPKAAPSPAPGASASPSAKLSKLAPADEYFGPLKMSPLGIRVHIGALGRRYNDRIATDVDLLHDAHDLEVALDDWRKKYASDEWLAPTAFHLEQLYQAIQSKEARARATAMLKYVIKYFPNTKYGHMSRLRLAQGFPPLHEEPPLRLPTPSPAPTESPSPAASESPSPERSATPSPAASGVASPAATTSPGATASPSAAPSASRPPSAAPSLLPSIAPSTAPR